ncbi:DNA-3-methyladenine glycosylase I [bacterium]|nr:DNA-3-methyladenine glycosylase I [bacterium]
MKTHQLPPDDKTRCGWCLVDPIYIDYHDLEWGTPVHDDRKWFEMLTLESAQAGLSWLTILKRREAYRRAYADWNVKKVAAFDEKDIERLLGDDSGIIRNRRKIAASICNAGRFIEVQKEIGSFDAYMWRFTDGRALYPKKPYRTWKELPTETEESRAMSKDLRGRGFTFVGPTICYAHMQACGLVNDHLKDCFRFKQPD